MKRTQRQFIVDILEMMTHAERFVEDMTPEDLEHDLKTQLALQRCFTIIGEAANKVDATLKADYPDVPWREMVSMRNAVVHGYWSVRLEIVLDTIRHDLPAARPLLQRVLDELPPEDDLLNNE